MIQKIIRTKVRMVNLSLDKYFKGADKALLRLQANLEKNMLRKYAAVLKEIKSRVALLNEKGVFNRNEMFRYSRIDKLEKEIEQEIASLAKSTYTDMKKGFKETYIISFLMAAYGLEKTILTDLKYKKPKKEIVETFINNPFDRIGVKNRNIANTALVTRQLKDEIVRGLGQGKGYRDIAQIITNRMNIGVGKALKIVRTESHRLQSAGRHESLLHASNKGVQMERVWVSALDGRTRDDHADADGQTVAIGEPFIVGGEELMYPGDPSGSAENTINCRCAETAVIKGFEPSIRRARETGRTSTIIGYKNYNEWYNDKIR